METIQHYIPALGLHWLTPLYDPIMHRLIQEDVLRNRLILEADILPGMNVLDLGCGTGTLTILIKQSHLMSHVYGLDADPQILEIASSKADQARTKITLERGMAYQLPFPNGWFDRVLSSLVLHHLTLDEKRRALAEVYRVLLPGGKFTFLDFGVPHGAYARVVSQVMRRTEHVDDNIRGSLPGILKEAGFGNITELERFRTVFGSLSLIRAEKTSQA